MKPNCFHILTDAPTILIPKAVPLIIRDQETIDFCHKNGHKPPKIQNCFLLFAKIKIGEDWSKPKDVVIRGRWPLYRELFMGICSRWKNVRPDQELMNYLETFGVYNPLINGVGSQINSIWQYAPKFVFTILKHKQGKYDVKVSSLD